MSSPVTKSGDGYERVAVCVGSPPKAINQRKLDEATFPKTYLMRADELLVDVEDLEKPAVKKRLRGWRRHGDPVRGMQAFRRAIDPARDPALPSAAPAAGRVGGAVKANAVFCVQGLRSQPARDGIPFRVAPRYQGQGKGVDPVPAERPADVPEPARGPGRRIVVGIVDTGIAQGRFLGPWLEPCIEPRWLVSAADEDPPDPDGSDTVESPAGHGTFVAGVIAQCEPRVRIHVVHAVGRQGAVSDRELARAIDRLDEETGRSLDILNLSLGGWTRNGRPPPMTTAAIAALPAKTAVVAAAGNLRRRRRFYPAALGERVIGVGAVTRGRGGWKAAVYSNRGAWVSAVTGDGGLTGGPTDEDRLVSCFFAAFPTAAAPHFDGWASWIGTSFTAPKVAGRIAALMIEEDIANARTAWKRLKARSPRADLKAFPNAVLVEDPRRQSPRASASMPRRPGATA